MPECPPFCERVDESAVTTHEDEHGPDEGIVLESFPAELRQAVDAAAEIGRLDGHQDLHLRRDLQHHSASQKRRARASTSAAS